MSASNDFPAFPVKLAGGPLGDVPAAGDSPVVLFLETNPSGFENLDLLDLAQSLLDESEKLFFDGQHDEACRRVGDACRVLEAVQ